MDTGTNAIGRIKYNRYKLLTFVLAALVIANATGITGWTVNTITGLEINLPELAWAAGASCEPDGECNADNESDCTDNGCCSWEDDPGKGGDPFCYCHCDPDEPYCIDGECEECRNDGDCDGDKPYCHSSKKICVECRNDGNCNSGDEQYCNPLKRECVECMKSTHCDPDQCCDEDTNKCYGSPSSYCLKNYRWYNTDWVWFTQFKKYPKSDIYFPDDDKTLDGYKCTEYDIDLNGIPEADIWIGCSDFLKDTTHDHVCSRTKVKWRQRTYKVALGNCEWHVYQTTPTVWKSYDLTANPKSGCAWPYGDC